MRHAFLIMAHTKKEQLIELIKQIDHPNNDIYIHIDAKVFLISDDEIKNSIRYSSVEIIREIKVAWGAYSQIQCELALISRAVKKHYGYYHLISGVDCLTKKMKDIHGFFSENNNKEFVHFQGENISKTTIEHVRYYHLLQQYTNASNFVFINKAIRFIEKIIIVVQKMLGVNRWKNQYMLQKGANWFSITHEFAEYVISQTSWVEKNFKYTLSGDELFLQSILVNSHFKDRLYSPTFDNDYSQCSRLIDWSRGKPYTFDIQDQDELLESEMIFARKCSKELVRSMRIKLGGIDE